jgi:hypothetical protein
MLLASVDIRLNVFTEVEILPEPHFLKLSFPFAHYAFYAFSRKIHEVHGLVDSPRSSDGGCSPNTISPLAIPRHSCV